jgi:hypothetical protein
MNDQKIPLSAASVPHLVLMKLMTVGAQERLEFEEHLQAWASGARNPRADSLTRYLQVLGELALAAAFACAILNQILDYFVVLPRRHTDRVINP